MRAQQILRHHGDSLLAIALTALVQLDMWVLAAVAAGRLTPNAASADLGLSPMGAWIAAGAALAFTVSLAWRRRAPLVVLALGLAATALGPREPLDASIAFAGAVMVAAWAVGAHATGGQLTIAPLGLVAIAAASIARSPDPSDELADFVMPVLLIGGPWLAGLTLRIRGERESALRSYAGTLEREREEQARAAVAEERTRIARELHDIVAHAIGVIVLQARGARRSLPGDPSRALEALDAIEVTGSGALTELRGLVGMLRAGDEAPELAPQPGLRELDHLAAKVREAGLPVEVTVEGEPVDLPTGVDLAAYRIVQEALTNALKHAGTAIVRVLVRYEPDQIELEIADSGSGIEGAAGEGHGLVGMRERVSLYGGRLEASPRLGGGYTVRASLPLGPASP